MNIATLKMDFIIIILSTVALTALSIVFEIDQTLAQAVHNTSSTFGWLSKEYAPTPIIFTSILFILFILIPPLRQKYPLFNHTALVWLFTFVFGAGLLVHTILKDTVERPRPRTTVILNGEAPFTLPFNLNGKAPSQFHDKSFPSGHVATAAMLIVPFFTLRRRKPKTAKAFLIAGLTFATLTGYGRMIYGAHFFTDVLWAITCVGLTASSGTYLIKEKANLKSRYTTLFILFTGFCLAWFNTFTKSRSVRSPASHISFEVPCKKIDVTQIDADGIFRAVIKVSGDGGPTKLLQLKDTNGIITLSKFGIFRNIECSAHLSIPKGVKYSLPLTGTYNNIKQTNR